MTTSLSTIGRPAASGLADGVHQDLATSARRIRSRSIHTGCDRPSAHSDSAGCESSRGTFQSSRITLILAVGFSWSARISSRGGHAIASGSFYSQAVSRLRQSKAVDYVGGIYVDDRRLR